VLAVSIVHVGERAGKEIIVISKILELTSTWQKIPVTEYCRQWLELVWQQICLYLVNEQNTFIEEDASDAIIYL
jgi:hypothetical protein